MAEVQAIHILAFPFPIPGHINPLMYFCERLVSSVAGFSVTFACNEDSYSLCLRTRDLVASRSLAGAAGLEEKLQVVSLPDGLTKASSNKGKPNPSENLERPAQSAVGMKPALEELLKKFELQERPVACLLTDTFNGWVQDVTDKFSIPRAAFWTSNAINDIIHLHLPQLMERGLVPAAVAGCKAGATVDFLPGLPPMPPTDLPLSFYYEHPILETIADGARRYPEAEFGLVNTLEELEQHAVSVVRKQLKSKYYCIGPCLSPDFFMQEADLDKQSKALGAEDLRCLEWLDKQDKSSVIYVSFGSVATMSAEQAEELALGLEQAGHPFLLVLRKTLLSSSTGALEEFIQRTGDRGLVVSWAPQMHILLHPATGGFLTHCGWNSTLEAICAGVPMLAWPCMAEQNVNCRELVHRWKIALEVKDEEYVGGAVSSRAVAGLVNKLMSGPEGREMRTRAGELRELARSALGPGGSSDLGLRNFARAVRDRAQ